MQSIIANRAGRAHRFLYIASFHNMLDPVGITSPNAGKKICLQLEPDREPIVFSFTDPPSHRLHTIGNAEQILHVMSNFVRDDVGLRKIASCTQAILEFMEKTQVDVNASIFWTIERTSGPAREPAAGPNLVREDHQLWLLVLAAHLPEDRMPGVFGIGQNDSDELRCLITWPLIVELRSLRQLRLLLRLKQRLRIAAEQKIKNYENDGANSAAQHDPSPAAGSASVFNVVAFSSPLPEHLSRIVARDSLASSDTSIGRLLAIYRSWAFAPSQLKLATPH